MNTISDAWRAWTAAVQQPGNVSQDEATDIIQTFGPTLTDAEGDAWFVAVAVELGRLGLINPATYVGLRNFANNNEVGANDLFDALLISINGLAETRPVNVAILANNSDQAKLDATANIAIVQGFKTGGTSSQDVQLDIALDQAIFALQGVEGGVT